MIFSWRKLALFLGALAAAGLLIYPSGYFLGMMHRRDPDRGVSISFFIDYLDRHPHHKGATLALARAYEAVAEPDNAIRVMRDLYAHRPGDPDIGRELLALLENAEDLAGAQEFRWRLFQDLNGRPQVDRQFLSDLLTVFYQQAVLAQDDPAAVRALDAMAARAKEPREVQYALLDLYRARRRFEEARGLISEWLKKSPQDVDLLQAVAEIFLAEGKPQEAQQTLAEALRLVPDSLQLADLRASIFESRGEWAKAVADLRRLTSKRPDNASWRSRLAYDTLRGGDFEGAMALYADIVSGRPEEREAWWELISGYSDRSRHAEAAVWLEKYLRVYPADERGEPLLVEEYSRLGRWKDASNYLKSRLEEHPGDPRRTRALADLLLAHGRFLEAADLLALLVDKDPGDKKSWWTLIYGYTDRKMIPEAAATVERYLRIYPRDPKAVDALAELKLQKGDKESAISLLQKYFSKKDGPDPEARR